MKELNPSDFHRVSGIFRDIGHNVPLIFGVLEHNIEGRVFVDNEVAPAVALVMFCDIFIIGGDPNNRVCHETLFKLLYEDIIPNCREDWFDLYSASADWIPALEMLMGKKAVDKKARRNFRISSDRARSNAWRESIPGGCVVRELDEALIAELDLDKGFWAPETKRFGVCVLKDNRIASECIAVFVGGGQCEISVETKEEHRRHGYAHLASSAFVDCALSKGINPNWACWEEKESSALLAKKLGYEEIDRCLVFILGK